MTIGNHVIVLMASVHETLKMETRLDTENIAFRTIAKPRAISEECGVVLRIDAEDIPAVTRAARNASCSITGFYRQIDDQWIPIE
jgi:Putative Se/S carrier protein-like